MANINLEKLKQLALDATDGPWVQYDGCVYQDEEHGDECVVSGTGSTPCRLHDASYIAAANPTTILALIEALELQNAKVAALCAEIEEMSAQLKGVAV